VGFSGPTTEKFLFRQRCAKAFGSLRLILLSRGFDAGLLPSLFLFPDPAPPDRFLLDVSIQKKPDSPLGDDQSHILIGVIF
jgi:hypothetical protein